MTASLILTLSACGGGSEGSGDNSAPSGGQETAAAADYVYSAEQVIIEDEAGELGDLSIDNLFFKDGKLYATGFYFGDSFTGSHVIMTFNPDGTDLQYTTLMGGMEDIITTTVGTDGNFYIAGLSYDADSIGAAQTGSTQDQEHAAETVPDDVEISGSDDMDSFTAEEVPGGPGSAVEEENMTAPGEGPTADTEDASYGPTDVAAEEEAEYGPGEDVEEFISEGEESPADEAGEEASDGITSPQDEFGDDPSEYDGEEELTVGDVEEVEGGYTESGEAIYVLSCMSADGQQLWSAAANAGNEADADYYINSIAYSDKGILVGSSKGLELYSKDDGSFIKMLSSGEETIGCTPYVMNDGTAVIMTAGSKGEELTAVDMESGALGTHYPIPGEAGMVSIFPGKTYDFYLTGTGAVFGMNLDDSGAVKVIDYVDSDMDITAMPCLTTALSSPERISISPPMTRNISLAGFAIVSSSDLQLITPATRGSAASIAMIFLVFISSLFWCLLEIEYRSHCYHKSSSLDITNIRNLLKVIIFGNGYRECRIDKRIDTFNRCEHQFSTYAGTISRSSVAIGIRTILHGTRQALHLNT